MTCCDCGLCVGVLAGGCLLSGPMPGKSGGGSISGFSSGPTSGRPTTRARSGRATISSTSDRGSSWRARLSVMTRHPAQAGWSHCSMSCTQLGAVGGSAPARVAATCSVNSRVGTRTSVSALHAADVSTGVHGKTVKPEPSTLRISWPAGANRTAPVPDGMNEPSRRKALKRISPESTNTASTDAGTTRSTPVTRSKRTQTPPGPEPHRVGRRTSGGIWCSFKARKVASRRSASRSRKLVSNSTYASNSDKKASFSSATASLPLLEGVVDTTFCESPSFKIRIVVTSAGCATASDVLAATTISEPANDEKRLER